MANKQVKLVIVGDGACGKTCSLFVFSGKKFPQTYVPTIFETYCCKLNNDINLQLFDTAGQEDYERLRPLSYPGTNVVVILFDITNPVSFDNACTAWKDEIRRHLPHVPIVLLGNKSDLRDDVGTTYQLKRQGKVPISEEKGKEGARANGFHHYMECSALQNTGVKEAFNKAAFLGYLQANHKQLPPIDGTKVAPKPKPGPCSIL